MAFLEDPRLRQRWNQIAHDAEAVTENAAAGIWSFQHNYINPCFSQLGDSIEQCTTVCLGDPEERLRRRRERERIDGEAEYSFDFYDDWYGEEEASGGLLGGWGGEDWDRLLAGTGASKKHPAPEVEQPRRKKGMSYGTRGSRRKASENDPTIIPSTQPIGFLSKLPWKMGGTLRYKPSAADLQDHPGRHGAEAEPLLVSDDESDYGELRIPRKRSGTTGSGDTSDSYRSRGDLFPSDGEGEEDAVPLDDDVTYDMVRKDDRSSGKSGRTRSSKGKRPVDLAGSRTVSRTTLGSAMSRESLLSMHNSNPMSPTSGIANVPSLDDLHMEEVRLREVEDEEMNRRRRAAAQLATRRGLVMDPEVDLQPIPELKPEVAEDEVYEADVDHNDHGVSNIPKPDPTESNGDVKKPLKREPFQAARLPRFG